MFMSFFSLLSSLTLKINFIFLLSGKFSQFVSVLDIYINENFSATLAYNKLLCVLKETIDNANTHAQNLTKFMKCLKYIFKFVVKSRERFSEVRGGEGEEPFQDLLNKVLMSTAKLMFLKGHDLLQAQSYCLKHIISSVPDLRKVYSEIKLSEVIVMMIDR